MEQVDIYDISSGAWYTQNTTGDPKETNKDPNGYPLPRMLGCAVAVSAPDNSSHQIYMHSGAGKLYGESFDDVWVLSLPMFRWKKAYEYEFGFFGHTCHLVGNNRYMLVLSGYREANWCERLVYVYDLSGMKWVDNYYPNTTYTVPQEISTIIGGNLQGGATVTAPEAGWGSNVEALFRTQTSSKPSPSPSTLASPSPSPSATPKPKSNTPVVTVLGGVLGSLLGVAAVLSGILFFLRRRRLRAAVSHTKPATLPEADPDAGLSQLYDGRASWNPAQELDGEVVHREAGHHQDG